MYSDIKIDFKVHGIGSALRLLSEKSLSVPIYQRSYAWKEQNIRDLFQDIGGAIARTESEYFLGSIVVVANDKNLEIIDGQQRIATIIILLAAIRDYFYKKGDIDTAHDLERDYLLSSNRGDEKPRLKLNESDNEFFMNNILARPDDLRRKDDKSIDSYLLGDAAKLALERINQIVNETNDPTNRLQDWAEYVRDKVIVIWLTVPDEANAFMIFETLNDRGLRLAISDLLKNYLFSRAGDRIGEVQERWTKMKGFLESTSDEDSDETIINYIRHLWSSRNGLTREKDLYKKIKGQLTTKSAVVGFSTHLADSAYLYAAMQDSSHAYWTSFDTTVRDHIQTLNYLKVGQYRPLLLAILNDFEQQETEKSLQLLVSWAVRFLISGGGGGLLEEAYSNQAAKITSKEIITASDLADKMSKVVPNDTEFKESFARARVSKNSLARYYLRALERQKNGEKQPETVVNPNEKEINLEHILPEKLSLDWTIDPTDHAAYWQRLGNMVLLQEKVNREVQNYGFDRKKSRLGMSKLSLTNEVTQYVNWGIAEIKKRQEELAELALKVWPAKL